MCKENVNVTEEASISAKRQRLVQTSKTSLSKETSNRTRHVTARKESKDRKAYQKVQLGDPSIRSSHFRLQITMNEERLSGIGMLLIHRGTDYIPEPEVI